MSLIIVNDQSNANYDVGNGSNCNTSALATQLSFENVASFTKCIIKIDGTTIDQINVHINGI